MFFFEIFTLFFITRFGFCGGSRSTGFSVYLSFFRWILGFLNLGIVFFKVCIKCFILLMINVMFRKCLLNIILKGRGKWEGIFFYFF